MNLSKIYFQAEHNKAYINNVASIKYMSCYFTATKLLTRSNLTARFIVHRYISEIYVSSSEIVNADF